MKKKYTKQELKKRKIHRIAYVLKGLWEEGNGAHSRIFDVLIEQKYIYIGRSNESKLTGEKYPEHVVPCAVIREAAFDMFFNKAEIEDVAKMIERLLSVAFISNAEQKKLDSKDGLKLKSTMPEDWDYKIGNRDARLELANIVLIDEKIRN